MRSVSPVAKTIVVMLLLYPLSAVAQKDLQYDANPWRWNGSVALTVSQFSFTNWAAGGEESYMVGLTSYITPEWSDGVWSFKGSWDGGFSVYKHKGQPPRSVDDEFELNIKLGHRLTDRFHEVALLDVQSQFWPDYEYYSSSTPTDYISNFMAPGYILGGVGIDYRIDSTGFSTTLAPVASKVTTAFDEGVDPTAYGVPKGKRDRVEFGAYMSIIFADTLFTNTYLKASAMLFQNYRVRFGPDFSFIGRIDYAITSVFGIYARAHLLNDNDLKLIYYIPPTTTAGGDLISDGPDLQIETEVGIQLGVSF
jgi:hypothetical protein